jgi:hypothetical protein
MPDQTAASENPDFRMHLIDPMPFPAFLFTG